MAEDEENGEQRVDGEALNGRATNKQRNPPVNGVMACFGILIQEGELCLLAVCSW